MSTALKVKIASWLCFGGALIFLVFVGYSLIFEPLWGALMGTGILGMGCVTHTFHDLRKPGLQDYDPLTFV